MGEDNSVALGFVVSNYYALPFLVALTTLFKNANAKYFYDIAILETDLTALNKRKIQELVSCPPTNFNNENVQFSLRFVNIAERVKELQKVWLAPFWAQYHFLLIPEVFSRYDKVVALNSDIVFNRDVAELYQIKLNDNEWVGAVIDTVVRLHLKINPNFDIHGVCNWLDEPLKYFNSGVILYNTKACRENKLVDKIIRQHGIMGPTKWTDQDLLNVCCQNHVHFLNPKWNVEAPGFEAHFATLTAKGVNVQDEREEHSRNRECPYILHWIGERKPWRYPEDELSTRWWKYARALPNYEEIIYTNICGLVRDEMAKGLDEHENKIHELLRSEMTKKLEECEVKSAELLRGEMTKKLEECEAKSAELLRDEMRKKLEEREAKSAELLRDEMGKKLEEREVKSAELLRGEMTKKLEEQGKRERQTVDRLGLLEARQRTADRVMSTRLSAAEQAVRKVRSDAREVALLPFTWLNLQRCRIASHLLFGKIGQHYTRKKRQLRARVRTALDFIRTQPNVSKNSTGTI